MDNNSQLILQTLMELKSEVGGLTAEVKATNASVTTISAKTQALDTRLQVVENGHRKFKWSVGLIAGAITFVGWVLNYFKP